jgi:hypothetical protein
MRHVSDLQRHSEPSHPGQTAVYVVNEISTPDEKSKAQSHDSRMDQFRGLSETRERSWRDLHSRPPLQSDRPKGYRRLTESSLGFAQMGTASALAETLSAPARYRKKG